jgi:hypothetical protein
MPYAAGRFAALASERGESTLLGHSASHSERLFLPQNRRSQYPLGSALLGGKPPFPIAVVVAASAPIPVVRT